MGEWTAPDRGARERIATDLGTSLLVEAGAGSGKTTAMVGRMVALVRSGTASVGDIAAVTFTRKAAAELGERFQEALERECRHAAGAERERLARALGELDRAFVGTIHAFCGRLLRERPFEAGVPPGFREVTGPDEERVWTAGWTRFLESLDARGSRLPTALERVGLRPAQLRELFREVAANPDVRFPAPPAPLPDPARVAQVRGTLEALLDDSLPLLPSAPPAAGWDALQGKLLALRFSRRIPGWDAPVAFFDALAVAVGRKNEIVQNRWGAAKEEKQAAKALCERWDAFAAEDGAPRRLLTDWLAHRYRPAIRFARAAAAYSARERRRAGELTFGDLLVLTADLLRRSGRARRELGERFRFLLVDEFQDTDPVQAEVLFLLAASDPAVDDWRRAVPRPGALFVVGDPKQSIYRFRRADLAVYARVKERFRGFGAVLELVANFRSGAAVEALVNGVFSGLFPPESDGRQAAFAPMAVRPRALPLEGVRWYAVEAEAGRGAYSGRRISVPDAAALASWIAARVASGERRPGDFMVLTRTRAPLAEYARALEARGLPVQLSGAALGAEEELPELVLLLRALADPGDAVLTVAVLEGLFFGCSHDDLHAHAAAGGAFSFAGGARPAGRVGDALARMRELWLLARSLPADAAVAAMVDRLGVLPWAAAGPLGAPRAGALLFALDALRAAALEGALSLGGAAAVLEAALDADADAPLVPGDADAVRVMNLHRAKGLEAKVVVLACPSAATVHPPSRFVERGADGAARGWVRVTDGSRRGGAAVVARPAAWDAFAAEEAAWVRAEEVRLLYVAATRAEEELVVARCEKTADSSPWAAFHDALDSRAGAELRIEVAEPGPRPALEEDAGAIVARGEAAAERRRALAAPAYRALAVTGAVRRGAAGVAPREGSGRGAEWGTAVHRALEAAARGADGDALRALCRGALVEAARPLDGRGEPEELDELLEVVGRVRASAVWARAEGAGRRLAEVPFALRLGAGEAEALGLDPEGAGEVLVEGVVDLAFREGGWVLADYKTGDVSGMDAWRRQVDLYARCWERITGEPVASRVIVRPGGEEVAW